MTPVVLLTIALALPAALGPGDHTRTVEAGGLERSYLVHVPKRADAKAPVPVVLALHGAMMNGPMMVWFCGLNATADRHGFVVVYPSGTGRGPFLTWNAGGFFAAGKRGDDVAFIGRLLDDLATVLPVDPKRVYACGMSNGAMMCYRLAAELSDRIAAIAPVAGTIAVADSRPTRPVPVLHFHGTKDTLVPYDRRSSKGPPLVRLQTVGESVDTWVRLNGCPKKSARTEVLSADGDKLRVTRTTYGPGKRGAEVVLVTIEGGGHTWPGQRPPVDFLGLTAEALSANELLWQFFRRHPLR